MPPADNAHFLADASKKRSQQARERAEGAIEVWARRNERPTVVGTANAAGVSRSWLYTQTDLISAINQLQQRAPCSRRNGRHSVSDASLQPAVEERLGRRLEKDWQQQYEHLYQATFAAELTAVDGITEALDRLTTPIRAASNGDHDGIRRSLEIVTLSNHFEGHIFSGVDVPRGKPAPGLFLHAARSMGVEPGQCAVIEDSAYGVQVARAAGMRAFGYCGGLTPASRLEGSGTVVFDDMRGLPELLAAGG